MEFDELLITTGVDALVRLVKEKKRIRLIDASKELGISESAIEDWARVLEEEGILKVEYHLSKVFLVWIQPSVEEVKKERESFYEEKTGIKKEISDISKNVKGEIQNLRNMESSFQELYKKLYPRLETLEKTIETAPTKKGKVAGTEGVGEIKDDIKSINNQLLTIRRGIQISKKEIDSVKKELQTKTKEAADSEKTIEEVDRLIEDMDAIEKRVQGVSDALPEGVTVKDINERFMELKKEFSEIRKRNSSLRMEMENLKETTDILGSVEKSMKKYTADVSNMGNEIKGLTKELNDVRKKSDDISKKLKRDMDKMERFSDSIDVAKSIMTKFPSQTEITKEMKRIEQIEKSVEDKIDAVHKLMNAVGPAGSTKDFTALQKKIAEKKKALTIDMKTMAEALKRESATFETYQNVKGRVLKSIDDYGSQLSELQKEVERVSKETSGIEKGLKEKLEGLKKEMGTKELDVLLKQAEDIKRKKKLMDEISLKIKSLTSTANNLNKRLDLLGKQAAILEIRGGVSAPAKAKKEKEIRQQLELTDREQEEFKRKREELRSLIKKLWEES